MRNSSEIGHLLCRLLSPDHRAKIVTTPLHPYPSSNRPTALSSPLPLPDRNPCSCFGWDHAHFAVLARTVVVGIAVVVVVAMLVLVIAGRKLRFGGGVADGKGSIGRVGWRKVRVKVRRMRSMSWMYLRKPWESKWI